MPAISLPYQLTKTLACALYEMQAISNVAPRYLTDTTLNSKYNNFPTTLPSAPPKLAFFGIGVNGFKNLNDQNLQAPFIPSSEDLDLYAPLPFRCVPVGSDLTPTVAANYRMRVRKIINGEAYWCYYLKKIAYVANSVQIISTNLTTGVNTILADLDPTNLTPTPTVTSAEGNTTATTKVSVSLTASVQITGAEVIEAINVLYGGNLLKSVISEIGIYTGNDQTATLSDGLGGTFSGHEVMFASLAYHYTSLPTPFQNPKRIENIALQLSASSSFLI